MFLLTCLMLVTGLMFAQNQRITGKVVSADDGQAVIGAYVMVKGTNQGTVSDMNGGFSLNTVPGAILQVSYMGMETREVSARNGMVIEMKTDAKELDEVIAVAYGSAKKSSFTGSAASLSSEKIASRPISNISKALDSQVAGIQSTSGGGQPGNSASIVIRGFGSINASLTPLYVVDGVPYDGLLSAISPSDIESMTVLKDASAGALYGSRGANGVVMITTKKGSDRTNINLKANVGFVSRAVKRYKTVGQADYVQLMFEALRNAYVFDNGYSWEAAESQAKKDLSKTLSGGTELYNPFKNYTWETIIGDDGLIQPDAVSAYNENWMDALENRSALRQEYQLSVTGGNDKTKTLLSLGYLNEEGVLKYTGFERFNGRLNVDNQANDWFKTGLSAAFSHTNKNYSDYGGTDNSNVWYSAQFIAPIYPVYTKNLKGEDVLDAFGSPQLDYGLSRPTLNNFNSIATLIDDKFDSNYDNFSGRTYLTLGSDKESAGFMKGIKLTANLGVDYASGNSMYYYNMYHGNFSSYNGMLDKYNDRMFSYTLNELLTWNRSFGLHDFDVLVGHEYYSYKENSLGGSKSGLVDGIYELSPATTNKGSSSYEDNFRIESFLSRLNYNYAEKYYLSLSWRTDASSRFHKDHRWGQFWSVGGNWRMSEEAFLQDADWLDNLAVRASYGVQGNNELDTWYAWQSLYDMTWPNANNAGAIISTLENQQITWEKNANFNFGVDARLFNRLDVGLEYYNRRTYDLLLEQPMALSTGFSGFLNNVGSISNKGFEFTVGAQIIDRSNFKWNTTVMGSLLKNRVLKLTEEAPVIGSYQVIQEGYEINTFNLAKSAGVDPMTGAQLYWVYEDGDGETESATYFNPGDDHNPWIDVYAVDDEGEVRYNAAGEPMVASTRRAAVYKTDDYNDAVNHRWYMGSRIPKINGAVNMDFEFFQNFDLSINTAYSIGGKILEYNYFDCMNVQYAGNTFSAEALRRWQHPGDITDVPRIELNGSAVLSDRYLIDASYLSIKNITFGYSLPKSVCGKAGLQNLRLFVTADNLYLFSHFDGMDPQYDFFGGTNYTYAPTRTVSMGIDINF